LTLAHPHHEQRAFPALRVGGPRRLPFGAAVYGFQVVRRQHRNRALCVAYPVLQALDPVGARHEVPRLYQHSMAVLLQGPGDPFRPGTIGLGVGDEKVPARLRLLIDRHRYRVSQDGHWTIDSSPIRGRRLVQEPQSRVMATYSGSTPSAWTGIR